MALLFFPHFVKMTAPVGRHLEHPIDHHVRRLALGRQHLDRPQEQSIGAVPTDGGQDNQAGMHVFLADQAAEVLSVLSDENTIFQDAPREHRVILLAATADMERMRGIVLARVVQPFGNSWRKTFVDEEPHAAETQGRPDGRPRMGLALPKTTAASKASGGMSGFSCAMTSSVSPSLMRLSTE